MSTTIEEIHVGDRPRLIGRFWDRGKKLPINEATDIKFFMKPPVGSTLVREGQLLTDGLDGRAKYDVVDEFNLDGVWEFQGLVVLGDRPYHSQWIRVVVHPNL